MTDLTRWLCVVSPGWPRSRSPRSCELDRAVLGDYRYLRALAVHVDSHVDRHCRVLLFPSSFFHPERPAAGLSWEGARPSWGHVSALPRRRFVKFCTRPFRGDAEDEPASAITIPGAPVRGMSELDQGRVLEALGGWSAGHLLASRLAVPGAGAVRPARPAPRSP